MSEIKQEEFLSAAVSAEATKEGSALLQGLGRRIRGLRIRKSWTRTDLARELGISRDCISKWENGKHAPPLEMLVALRKALGTSLDELIVGAPAVEPTVRRFVSLGEREELRRHVEAMRHLLIGVIEWGH